MLLLLLLFLLFEGFYFPSNFFSSFSNREKLLFEEKQEKLCVCVKEKKKLCDVDWRDDDDDGVLCVLEADGFSSFLLCSINDLDRDGLSNHNSSWLPTMDVNIHTHNFQFNISAAAAVSWCRGRFFFNYLTFNFC